MAVPGRLMIENGGRMAFYRRNYCMLKKVNTALLGLAMTMGLSSAYAAETKKWMCCSSVAAS